jgi:hypothetical protein
MASDKPGVTLVVAWPCGSGYNFGRVSTAEAFTEKLRAVVDAEEKRLRNDAARPYALGDDIEDDEYMTCPLDRLPRDATKPKQVVEGQKAASKGRVPAVTTSDPNAFRRHLVAFGAMGPIGAKALKAKKTISFYAILKGNTSEDRVAYVRRLNPLRLAKPGNILAGLKDTLTVLQSDVFAMDDRVDIIIRPTTVDIVNKGFFDSLFFGLGSASDEIDSIVTEMLSSLPIQAFTQKHLIGRSRLRKRVRRKMLEIRHSGHLASVTIADFKRALDEAGLPHKRFIALKDRKETIFASEDDTDLLFYVLNDDLFKGALTGKPYAVSKKHVRTE